LKRRKVVNFIDLLHSILVTSFNCFLQPNNLKVGFDDGHNERLGRVWPIKVRVGVWLWLERTKLDARGFVSVWIFIIRGVAFVCELSVRRRRALDSLR